MRGGRIDLLCLALEQHRWVVETCVNWILRQIYGNLFRDGIFMIKINELLVEKVWMFIDSCGFVDCFKVYFTTCEAFIQFSRLAKIKETIQKFILDHSVLPSTIFLTFMTWHIMMKYFKQTKNYENFLCAKLVIKMRPYVPPKSIITGVLLITKKCL